MSGTSGIALGSQRVYQKCKVLGSALDLLSQTLHCKGAFVCDGAVSAVQENGLKAQICLQCQRILQKLETETGCGAFL